MAVRIYHILSPVFDENCYIIVNDKNDALIVDPGAYTKTMINELLADINAFPRAILITHGHPDHLWDAGKFNNIPTYIPKPDKYRISNPSKYLGEQLEYTFLSQLGDKYTPIENLKILPDEIYTTAFEIIDGFYLRAIACPGHTEGSTLFLFSTNVIDCTTLNIKNEYNLYAFVGDIIFASSVGRTDLAGGDRQVMLHTLRTICNIIDPNTLLLPGHGLPTQLAHEKANNEHLKYAMKMG